MRMAVTRPVSALVATGFLWPVAMIAALCLSVVGSAKADETHGAYFEFKQWEVYVDVTRNEFKSAGAFRMTITGPRGDAYREISLSESQYVRLSDVSIKVYDASGKLILTRSKKDMTRACGYGWAEVYRDVCVFFTTVDVPGYPFTIEYSYTQTGKSLFFLRGVQFQSQIPTARATFRLTCPALFGLYFKVDGAELEPVVNAGDAGTAVYVWQMDSIPAHTEIKHAPPGVGDPIQLRLAADEIVFENHALGKLTWAEIGRWYSELARGRYTVEDPDEHIDSPDRDLMKRMYDEVTSTIRYAAIEIGIGGWQPSTATETARRAYGDCKDMSTLLIGKLRAAGVRAYPALVLTRSHGVIDAAFPSFDFNHVIVAAIMGSDTIWMDPTCATCPWGDIPWEVEGVDVLAVTDNGGELWRTPVGDNSDNTTVRVTTVWLSPGKPPHYRVECRFWGNDASSLRHLVPRLDGDGRQRLATRLLGGGPQYGVDSVHVAGLDRYDGPLHISIWSKARRANRVVGDAEYIAAMPFAHRPSFDRVDLTERSLALANHVPELYIDSVMLIIEHANSMDEILLPDSIQVTSLVGNATFRCRRLDTAIVSVLTRAYERVVVEPSEFDALAGWRAAVRSGLDSQIKVIHGGTER